MADQEIIDLVIDAKNLSSDELNQTADDVEKLGDAVSKTQSKLDQLEIDRAAIQSYRDLRDEIKTLNDKLAKSEVQYDKSRQSILRNKEATDEEREAVKKQSRELKQQQKILNSKFNQLEKAKTAVKSLGVNTKNAVEVERKYSDEIRKTSVYLKELKDDYKNETNVLRQQYAEKKKLIDQQKKERDERKKTEGVYAAAARDRTDQINREIAAAKKAQAAKEKQLKIDAEIETEQKRVTAAIGKYETELRKLNTAFVNGDLEKSKYIKAESKLRTELKLTEKQVKETNKAIAADGAALAASKKAREEKLKQLKLDAKVASEQRRVTLALKKYEAELEKLHAEYQKGNISKKEYIKAESKLRSELRLTEKQIRAVNKAVVADSAALSKKQKSTDLLTKATRRLAQAYTVLLAAQKASESITSSVKQYGELEAAQVKVQKTTDLMREQIVGMTEELQTLATEVTPTATNELLKYAEIAGQLGAQGTEDILRLASAADTLNVSTDLAGEEAINLLSRILTMTNEGLPAIDGLASVVVDLGNNVAATESEIVQMTKEIVTGTTSINLGSAAAAAYGATLKELGQTGERSRSTFTRLSVAIKEAVQNGGDDLEVLQNITGKTADQLEKDLGERPEAVLNSFVRGLAKLRGEGQTTSSVLASFGITATESVTVLDALANNVQRLEVNLKRSNSAQAAGNKHIIEAAKAYATQESSIGRLLNKFTKLQTEIGEAFSDETNDLVDTFGNIMDDTGESIISMMEGVGELGRELVELADVILSTGVTLAEFVSTFAGAGDILQIFYAGINSITGVLQLALAGITEVHIKMLEFLNFMSVSGKQYEQDIERLRGNQAKLFKGMERDLNDVKNNVKRFYGESSDAYEDLVNSASKYGNAVKLLSKDQQAQLDQILKSGVYNKDLEDAYRELTAEIILNNRQIEIQEKLTRQKIESDKAAAAAKKERALVEEDALIRVEGLLQDVTTGETTLDEVRKQADADLKNKIITEKEHTQIINDVLGAEKRLADAKEAAVISTKTHTIEIEDQSNKLVKLNQALDDNKKKQDELNRVIESSTATLTAKAKAERDLLLAKREQKKLDDEIKFQNDIEKTNVFELSKLKRELTAEIEKLNNAKLAGKKIDRESEAELDSLQQRLAIVNDLLGDEADKTDKVSESKQKNTEVIRENTEAKKKNAEVEKDAADAEAQSSIAASAHVNAQLELRKQYDYTSLSVDELTKKYDEMDKGVRKLSVFASQEWFGDLIDLTNAAAKHRRETVNQTIAMKRLYEEVVNGSLSFDELKSASDRVEHSFSKLDDSQLDPLRDAIKEAQDAFDSLDDSINNSLSRTQDRLDRLLGDEAKVIARRFDNELTDANKLLNDAKLTGDAELVKRAQDNIDTLKRAQNIELKQFKDEERKAVEERKAAEKEAAEAKRDLEKERSNTIINSSTQQNQVAQQPNPPVIQQQDVAVAAVYTVNLIFSNTGTARKVDVVGQESAQNLVDTLTDIAENNLTGVS